MILPSTREIILRLKDEKENNDYSVPQIQKMCWDNGLFMCLNTIRNIFANGSEDGSFSYEHTLRPIANVLLTKDGQQSGQVEIMEKQLELLANQLQTEREAHNRSIKKLNEQIDSLRKTIKEKDELIHELMEKYI